MRSPNTVYESASVHAHAACTVERPVVRVDPLRAVLVHLDLILLEIGTQLMPNALCRAIQPATISNQQLTEYVRTY